MTTREDTLLRAAYDVLTRIAGDERYSEVMGLPSARYDGRDNNADELREDIALELGIDSEDEQPLKLEGLYE